MTPVEVTCPAGSIVGTPIGSAKVFHSIEYSRITAPFNDAVRAHTGLLIDATEARPEAIALTITTPEGATDSDDLPVMVWIHGGRFEEGSHADTDTGAEAFAAQGVIHVSIGYRLTLPGLVQFPSDNATHFRAADDCQLALEWVQKNIEFFGGDPTNVTLVGQSAGANLVLWLARRDHYRGAFRRAVALSPVSPRKSFAQRKASLRACLGTPLTREALNAASPEKLARGYQRFRTLHATDLALGPGPLDPAQLAPVDLIVTSTRDEFYQFGANLDRRSYAPAAARLFGRTMGLSGAEASDYLEACREIDADHLLGRLFSDSLVRRFVDQVAEDAQGRVWQAEFVSPDETPAYHCSELPSLFAQAPNGAGEGLNGWLSGLCHHGEPGWPEYNSADTTSADTDSADSARTNAARTTLRVRVDGSAPELVTDPLGYLRGAFTSAWR